MKNDKAEKKHVENAEEQKKKPFFFPNQDRTIMATSITEAREILEKENSEVDSKE